MLRTNFKDPQQGWKTVFNASCCSLQITPLIKRRGINAAVFPWLKKTLSQLLYGGVNKSAMMQQAEMLPSGT